MVLYIATVSISIKKRTALYFVAAIKLYKKKHRKKSSDKQTILLYIIISIMLDTDLEKSR